MENTKTPTIDKLVNEDLIHFYMKDYSLCIENISNTLFNLENDISKETLEKLLGELFDNYPLAKEILLPSCASISKEKYNAWKLAKNS